MKYLISSDHHFGHSNLCKPEYESRPVDFNEQIIRNTDESLQKYVSEDLTYITLGDMCFGGVGPSMHKAFLYRFNGETDPTPEHPIKLIAVRGNHDPKETSKTWDKWGYTVCSMFMLRYAGKMLVFSHEPINWHLMHALHKTMPHAVLDMINIHGHLHTAMHRGDHTKPEYVEGKQILIAQEFMDYRPIDLDVLLTVGHTPKWNGEKFVSLYA